MMKTDTDVDTKLVIKQQYDSMEIKTVATIDATTTEEWEHGSATVSRTGIF